MKAKITTTTLALLSLFFVSFAGPSAKAKLIRSSVIVHHAPNLTKLEKMELRKDKRSLKRHKKTVMRDGVVTPKEKHSLKRHKKRNKRNAVREIRD